MTTPQRQQWRERIRRMYSNSPLLQASLWYVAGRSLQKGLAFLSVFVFTRLLLPDQYGTVAIFLTWRMLFGIVLTGHVDQAVERARFDFDAAQFRAFVQSTVLLGVGLGAGGALLLALLPADWHLALFQLPKSLVVLAALLALVVVPYRTQNRVYQITNRHRPRTLWPLALEMTSLLLSVVLVLLAHDGALGLAPDTGRILGVVLATVCISLLVMPRGWLRPSAIRPLFWRYALVFALPLVPHLVGDHILTQFDRIMIDATIGRAEAGLYSFAYNVGALTTVLHLGLNAAWVPWFFRRMQDGDRATIDRRLPQIMLVGSAITIGFMVMAPVAVRWLVPPTYWDGIRLVPIIMAGGFFQLLYILLLQFELFYKRTGYASVGTIIAAGVNIGLNLLLLPIFGYTVAAWTTLASYGLVAVIHYGLVTRRLGVTLRPVLPMLLLTIALTLAVAGVLFVMLG